jgi:hypothetical protein
MTDENEATDEGQDEAHKLVRRLADFFDQADVPVPDDLNVRTVYVGLSSQEQAVEIGGMLRGKKQLFRKGHDLGTIHPKTGEWESMDQDRFATWLPLTAGIYPYAGTNKKTGKPKPCSFKSEDMRRVLRSDELRNSVPEIVAINQVRLPVWRGEGKDRKLAWLPFGYDPETLIYTVKKFEYNVDPDVHESTKYLRDLLKYFPMDERSESVQIAAMLSVYCRALYGGRPPLFLLNGNLPGSGKSRLGDLILTPHGDAGKAGFHWRDANEIRKELDATASELDPYIMFDDVVLPKGMKLRNTDLNRWLTARVWEARQMHTQKKIRVPVHAVTIMTGTQVELDDHIGRRSLLVDLQAKQKAKDRVLPQDAIVLDDDFLDNPEIVRKVLEALAGLVLWWQENAFPKYQGRPLQSFENWSKIIPAIVQTGAYGDCLVVPEGTLSGDVDNREFEILVQALVRDFCGNGDDAWVSMLDIIRTARFEGLFASILFELEQIVRELDNKRGWEWDDTWVPMTDIPDHLKAKPIHTWSQDEKDEWALQRDPDDEGKRYQAAGWTDRSIETKWGNHFRTYSVVDQWFTDPQGVYWTMEKKRRNLGSGFLIRRVRPDEQE